MSLSKIAAIAYLFLATSLVVPSSYGEPISIADQHPFSLTHWSLRPESAVVREEGEVSVGATLLWSNTYNRRGGYTVDSESVVFEVEAEYGLTEHWEVEVILPVIHRGGGVLDSVIKEWDQAIGFPNDRRESAQDDEFEIGGENTRDEEFSWEESGSGLGNIPLTLRYGDRIDDLAYAVFGSVSLPTGRRTFGASAVDVAFGGLLDYGMDWWVLNSGAALSYYGDRSVGGVEFYPLHLDAFIGASVPIWEYVGGYVGVLYRSALVDELRKTPSEHIYLDVGLDADLGRGWKFVVFVRENPIHSSRSTDVTMGVGLSYRTDSKLVQ